jgi:hypothetical protein
MGNYRLENRATKVDRKAQSQGRLFLGIIAAVSLQGKNNLENHSGRMTVGPVNALLERGNL